MERCVVPIFSYDDINDPRATQIIDGLYLGCDEGANDELMLDQLNIKKIVRVGEELSMRNPDKYDYMNIDIYDHNDENIYQHFESSFNFIDKALIKKENVFVHCKFGISRSATIVISYIIQKFKYRTNEAMAFISSKRPMINPNKGFIKQLNELDLRVSSRFLEPKIYGAKSYTNLPIKVSYKVRDKASCRIKLKKDIKEKDVIAKQLRGKMKKMSQDEILVKLYQILSKMRENLIHLPKKNQKKKILELIEDKDILSQIAFSSKKKLSKLEKTRKFRNIRIRLRKNAVNMVDFLFSSQFDKDYGNKLK